MVGDKLSILGTFGAFYLNTVPRPHDIQALTKFERVVRILAQFRGFEFLIFFILQVGVVDFKIFLRGWRDWELPFVSFLVDLLDSIAAQANQLISGLK